MKTKQGTQLPFGPIYLLAKPDQNFLKNYLDKMVSKELIRSQQLPMGAPCLFALKKDSLWQFCIHNWRFNNRATKKQYPSLADDNLLE